MKGLPLEVIAIIADFANVESAKSLGITCRAYYWCTLDRIWNRPNLKLISVHELSGKLNHLPIYHLSSRDVLDFYGSDYKDLVRNLNKIKKLKSITLNHSLLLADEEVSDILKLKCDLYVYTSIIRNWNTENIEKIKNRKEKITLHFQTYLCSRWSLEQLNRMEGLPINYIDTSIFYLFDNEGYDLSSTHEFVDTLRRVNAKSVHLMEMGYCFISFTRIDLLSMKNLKIKSISSSFLKDYFGPVHPWKELQ